MKKQLSTLVESPKSRTIQALRRLIEEGMLRTGDRLPAEEKLAEQLNVSRMTVRSALDVLQVEGLVRRERNFGCYCTLPSSLGGRGGLMSSTVVLISDLQHASSGQVFSGSSAAIVSGVIDRVSRHGINFLHIYNNLEDEAWLKDLVVSGPKGVILSCWKRTIQWQLDVSNRLTTAKIHLVTWGDFPAMRDFDCVTSDHVSGTARLVEALARQGKKRILRLWTPPPEAPWIKAHNEGYEQSVAALGLESIPATHVEGLSQTDPRTDHEFRIRVRQFAGYLAEYLNSKQPIDAIMVSTDCEALTTMAACKLFGRDDILVTGYDNNWQTTPERQWEPRSPFATVDKGNHRLGEEMVELLLARIAGTLSAGPQRRLIEQKVILCSPATAPEESAHHSRR